MDVDRAHVPENAAKQRDALAALELRRRMKQVAVPTSDSEVRAMLRRLTEPITLFGEKEMERSLRLRKLLATAPKEQLDALRASGDVEPELEVPLDQTFYTEGSEELKLAREQIAQFSLGQAALRLTLERDLSSRGAEVLSREHAQNEESVQTVSIQSSELGDDRPVAACSVAADGARLLTGSWSGLVRCWSLPSCTRVMSVQAHGERLTDVCWHPEAAADGEATLAFATASADRTACLWTPRGEKLRTLGGHTERLARIAWHPMGRHLGTASFDQTWRLWDAETGTCLQEQEGHSRAVYTVCFQCDGSLAASGGLDALGRLWDLRTGRNVLNLEGHIRPILAMDFSPNGYLLATGSGDNTARIYDIRRKEMLAVLPGHTSLISRVRFEPTRGSFLLTCGYDRTSRLWTAPSFKLAKTLLGHEDKVMDGDLGPAGSYTVVTTGFDRTVKIFAPN